MKREWPKRTSRYQTIMQKERLIKNLTELPDRFWGRPHSSEVALPYILLDTMSTAGELL
ncbi:hypothetical protein GCM10009001_35810 [Virgibacillus siamensis]|uniref:Uncharacterized protein n=1 Tax=Virgibacillus siamensis TaxID=480071 RepID=A0ABN1GNS6_9BACI